MILLLVESLLKNILKNNSVYFADSKRVKKQTSLLSCLYRYPSDTGIHEPVCIRNGCRIQEMKARSKLMWSNFCRHESRSNGLYQ